MILKSFTSYFKKPDLEIFIRHCHFSKVSSHKERFKSFSKRRCFNNFFNTLEDQNVRVTFFLDTFYEMPGLHFVKEQKKFPVIEIKEGTEAGAFLRLLDYVATLKPSPKTILYFLEDDYLHKEGWVDILIEGFTIEKADYITLYDHKDKYDDSNYEMLRSKIFQTNSCHWRTTPSTTNTFATRFKTLQEDLDIHREFSSKRTISSDHEKFCKLAEKGRVLVSSIPGFATHAEPKFASPCTNWENILKNTAS